MRIILVIVASLAVAGGTGFYVMQGLRPPAVAEAAVPVEAPKQHEVFVPTHHLAVGTILLPEHLARMPLPETAITETMIVADPEGETALTGSVARQSLPQGVPIARSAVVQPGERGFLAAVLPKGKRAITIAISEVAGLGGLVLPGDRVDIILTYSIAGDLIDAGRDIRASETVMQNLRVLALDQRLGGEQITDDNGKVEMPPIARMATLEVSPREAEMVTLAQSLGDLSLVLNSVRDGGEPEGPVGRGPALAAIEATARSRGPREMTLDSDVTSLLRRQLARTAPELAPTPAASPDPLDRTAKIQVVRGVQSQAVELGLETNQPQEMPPTPTN